MRCHIRSYKPGDHTDCERILRSLPGWFGIETAIVQYVRDTQTMQTWIVEDAGQAVGFLTLNRHNAFSSEIQVMAVVPTHHRRGIGRQLIEHVQEILRGEKAEFLHVKTLGPSKPNENYEKTCAFYEHMGFKPLEENKLWGNSNPCLMMIKHLGPSNPLEG